MKGRPVLKRLSNEPAPARRANDHSNFGAPVTSPSGVLLVDKPPGPTSHDVVGVVRSVAGTRKVGHAGTLDPFASGLLLVLLGPATRLSEYLLKMDKEYQATVHLGLETTTHDREGSVVAEAHGWLELGTDAVEDALRGFQGRVSQRPPVYSAKKVRGEPAHRRVRRGESVDLESVEVEFYEVKLLGMDLPRVRLRLRCSSGTYVRAFARDLGRALGVGGHLSALRRTGVGPFSVASAVPLSSLTGLGVVSEHLLPPAGALSHLPAIDIGPEDAARIRLGQFLSMPDEEPSPELEEGAPVLVLLDGELVAVASRSGARIRPRKVFD